MKFNTQQLAVLQTLESKWTVWKNSQVSLFTLTDKTKLDEVRTAFGLSPANIACHSCFITDISEVMKVYDQQKQSSDSTTQSEATGGDTKPHKKK